MLHTFGTTRLSHHNTIKHIFSAIFAILAGSFAAIIVYTAPHTSHGMFSSETIDPISPNFSAPLQTQSVRSKKEVIGFLPYWGVGNNIRIYPEYMDQIIYFGVTLKPDGSIARVDANNNVLPEWNILNSDELKSVMQRAQETDTKVIVAVKNFTNSEIDELIGNKQSSKRAIKSIQDLITTYGFDGVNIDFEYFSQSELPPTALYNNFLHDLVTVLRSEKADVIISFDVNATVVYRDPAYDMVKISELVDQVIIMGYDYHQAQSIQAGPIAPVHMQDGLPSVTRTLDSMMGRVPSEKIILGTPFYGFEWQTRSTEFRSKTIPGTGAVATYKRVRELIENRDDVSIHYDDLSMSPWLTYTQNGLIKQIYYEDEKSLTAKIDLIHERKLQGMALWALGYEGDYIEPWIVIKEGLRTP